MPVPTFTDRDEVIRIDGVVDSNSVRALLAATATLPNSVGIIIDVSESPAVEDVAVALLADGLSARRRFQLRGLSVHHQRLLRYLGLCSRDDPDREILPLRSAG